MVDTFNSGLGSSWRVATLAATAAGISGALISYMWNESKSNTRNLRDVPQKWIRVGTVSQLMLYPVKSCKGINVEQATATQIGLKVSDYFRDRFFMVVDSRYVFQTQRTIPRLVLISVSVKGNQLTFNAPEMPRLTIEVPADKPELRKSCRLFDDHVALTLDCGSEIAQWLDTFLGQSGFRLVYHPLDRTQRDRTPLQKKFPTFVPEDKPAFQDQTAYMLMTEESVEELNKKLDTPVTHRNFRPSILIKGIPEPFAEDFWSYVRIGGEDGPVMKYSKPCTRCKLTTVNPDTGVFSKVGDPLKTLTKIKRKYGNEKVNELVKAQGVMGIQLGLIKEGVPIKVGDPVYAAAL